MSADSDYYAVLGVAADAEYEQIRKAFRERVRACHPDRVANLDEDLRRLAEEKMVELNEAYAVLRNPARRAAYDDRRGAQAAGRKGQAQRRPTPQTAERSRQEPAEPRGDARNRIGEQQFVARAAAEEFQQHVKRAVAGHVEWTPVAFPGTTLALRGGQGRKAFYFVLFAAPQLEERQLRRFLSRLETWAGALKPRIWGRDYVYGFAAAVEFLDQERLRKQLDQFNRRRKGDKQLRAATLIDLVNWHVAPGDSDLFTRLSALIKEG